MVTIRHCHGTSEIISGQRRIVMPDRTGAGTVYNRIPESVYFEHMYRLRGVRKCIFRTNILVRNRRASVQGTYIDLLFTIGNSTNSLFSGIKMCVMLLGYTRQL